MLALTQAQGIVLAVGGAIFLAVAGGVLVLRGRHRAAGPDIPRGMRPGPSDSDLETPLLQKLQGWGLLMIVFLVIWVPGTWLFEPETNLDQERQLKDDAIHRGSLIVELFSEENQSGFGCVQCHGPELEGGVILSDAPTPAPRTVPNLRTVCGGPFTGHPAIHGVIDIYNTIAQGRGQMPSWSVRYEGALNEQQINDLITYLISIQDEAVVTSENNVCTNPEAATRADEEFPGKPPATDNPDAQV